MKYLRILTAALLCIGFFSCEKRHVNDNLYDSSVCIINNGLQPVTLYDLEGKTHSFSINAYCSGFYDANPNVRLVYNMPGVLDAYNAENGTSYRLLPENCYKLDSRHLLMSDNRVSFIVTFDCDKIAALTDNPSYNDIQDYVIPYTLVSETEEVANPRVEDVGNIFIKPELKAMTFNLEGPTSSEVRLEGEWYYMPFKLSTAVENKWDVAHGFEMEFSNQDGVELGQDQYSVITSSEADAFDEGVSEINYEIKIHRSLLKDASTWVNIKATAGTVDSKGDFILSEVTNWKFEIYSLWDKSGVTAEDLAGSCPGDAANTAPIYLFDGKLDTFWKNQNVTPVEPSPWLIQIDMKNEVTIHAIGIYGRQDVSQRPGACRTGGFRFDKTVTDIVVPAEQCASNGQWDWHKNLDAVKALFDVFYNYDYNMAVGGAAAPGGGADALEYYLGPHWVVLDEPVTTSVLQWWIISESSWDRPVATVNGSGGNRFTQAAELEIMLKTPGVSKVE